MREHLGTVTCIKCGREIEALQAAYPHRNASIPGKNVITEFTEHLLRYEEPECIPCAGLIHKNTYLQKTLGWMEK